MQAVRATGAEIGPGEINDRAIPRIDRDAKTATETLLPRHAGIATVKWEANPFRHAIASERIARILERLKCCRALAPLIVPHDNHIGCHDERVRWPAPV